jgi:hypothetical protein
MEQIHVMPPLMKMADWQTIVAMLMENMVEIEVPEELTMRGQFVELLEAFCEGRVQGQAPEEITLGKPYSDEDEGLTYFKLDSLMRFLRNHKFDRYSRGQIQERIKELNGGDKSNGRVWFKTSKGDQKQMRVWWVPMFREEVEIPPANIPKEEVPF